VTDNKGAESSALVKVEVNAAPVNKPPVAKVGSNQSITLPLDSVLLDGSGSSDSDGKIVSYLWTKITGSSKATILKPTFKKTEVNDLVVGNYLYQLKVTDDKGLADSALIKITVKAAPLNTPPVAKVGNNQSITLPLDSVLLDGSSSSDPDGKIVSYLWTEVVGSSNVTIASPASTKILVTDLVSGSYIFQLKVTDDKGATDSALVKVKVNAAPVNAPPIADAGGNRSITLPLDSILLDGGGSSDLDGEVMSYQWTRISGSTQPQIIAPSKKKTWIKGLVKGDYLFQLKVIDNQGSTDSVLIKVTVNAMVENQKPKANAGDDIAITLPQDSALLDGEGSMDPDGRIVSYDWVKISGPDQVQIMTPSTKKSWLKDLGKGNYVFQLKVTDDKGAIDSAIVKVTVSAVPENQLPQASGGDNVTITLPLDSVLLDGSASSDPDGKIVSYLWKEISGSKAIIISPMSEKPRVKALVEGNYIFQLKVIDDKGGADSTFVTVTVRPPTTVGNKPPTVTIDKDITIILPLDSVLVDGSGSSDPDGKIVSYLWTKVSGSSKAIITSPASGKTQIIGLVAGNYIFQLKATDDKGAADSAVVRVKVKAASVNVSPLADGGENQSITLPLDSVLLDGSGSTDSDGSIESYQWKRVSGSIHAQIIAPSKAKTWIKNLTKGTYLFQLKVTDNEGAVDSVLIKITVNVMVKNQTPEAKTANNVSVTLPINSVSLDGSGSSDPDGKIVSYLWTRISGSSKVIITSPVSEKTKITDLVKGTYVFQLKVTDNKGAADSTLVKVEVKSMPVNAPPVAATSDNQAITLPLDSVLLDGSGSSDPDGKIVSYLWTKISGSSKAIIISPASEKTEIKDLVKGNYVFQLKVTDDRGAVDSALVQVRVNSTPVNDPPAASASGNQVITLPLESILLDGSGSSDVDGSIASFQWKRVSGPAQMQFISPSKEKTWVKNLTKGDYVFQLKVIDNKGATDSALVKVRVGAAPSKNESPVASAGNNISIVLPVNTVSLDGSISSDPDGKIVSYLWTKISGSSKATIASPTSAKTQVKGLVAGNYLFQLKVTDNKGATDSALVNVNVNAVPVNKSPISEPGNDQSIILPVDSVLLDGSRSSDPDGKVVYYHWIKISGPKSGEIISSSSATTWVKGLSEGRYIFQLTVIDNKKGVSSKAVEVTVDPALNKAPIAAAGEDITITLPTNSIVLNGNGSADPDGKIINFKWVKESGPTSFTIANNGTAQTTVTGLVTGIYTFTLIVTDDKKASDSDNVVITVVKAPKKRPIADAGKDIFLTLPRNSAMLNGSHSYDPDGVIVDYQWEQMSGPTEVLLSHSASADCFINGLEMGTYDFKLTVTDNSGTMSTSTVSVFVNPAKDLSKTTFTIYPNPVHSDLHVKINKTVTGLILFRMIDVRGRVIKVYNYGSLPEHFTKSLNMRGVSPGIYFLQLIEDNQLRETRIVIKY
jgi:ribosomal protein L14